MILSSKKDAIIIDSESNTYKLEQFQYSIDKEILKGENIVAITSDKENKSDKFFFKTGFFDLKKNEFLGKDIVAKFHKDLFGDSENDPRISAVSGFGDKINTYFKKGVFTSCKKTCLLYTSDAADDSLRVDLGGRRIIKKILDRLCCLRDL